MRRQLIRGETVPLEAFAEVMREHARRIGAEALMCGNVPPLDAVQVLEASDEDLRTVQLCSRLTYTDVAVWAEKLQPVPIKAS